MSSIAARTYLTPEEYIAAERKATLKSEYLSGEIVTMSGANDTHNLITMNTSNALYGHSGVKPNPLGLGYKPAKSVIPENKLDNCSKIMV